MAKNTLHAGFLVTEGVSAIQLGGSFAVRADAKGGELFPDVVLAAGIQ